MFGAVAEETPQLKHTFPLQGSVINGSEKGQNKGKRTLDYCIFASSIVKR